MMVTIGAGITHATVERSKWPPPLAGDEEPKL
jgi:hypothetical protein